MQHTAACSGLRPVAKALGAAVGLTYRRGMGWLARWLSSWTIRYICGNCCGSAGTARIALMASLSEFQYV